MWYKFEAVDETPTCTLDMEFPFGSVMREIEKICNRDLMYKGTIYKNGSYDRYMHIDKSDSAKINAYKYYMDNKQPIHLDLGDAKARVTVCSVAPNRADSTISVLINIDIKSYQIPVEEKKLLLSKRSCFSL